MTIQNNETRGSRRVLKASFVGATMLALLIGCSTQVDDVDGNTELSTTQQALYNGDICDIRPTDPSCTPYDPPPTDPPTVSGTPTINTTTWTLSYAGWQLQVNPLTPVGSGSSTLTSDDYLKASMTMTRTSTATTTSMGYGAAIVRRIPKPGGTIDTACTKNADCYGNGVPRVFDSGDQDGPQYGFNYCAAVGTSTTKTCWQRAGKYAGPSQTTSDASWQNVRIPNVNETAWTTTGSRSFDIPHANGAPVGTVQMIPTGATYQYSVLAELNLVGQVTYTDATGSHKGAPCSLYKVVGPNGIPYEEDPAFCARILRPAQTFNPWRCGDGLCNGTETVSTCYGDCYVPPDPGYCGDGICGVGETSTNCKCDCMYKCVQYPPSCGCL